MDAVDANVLLYAVNSASDRHREARSWLDGTLSGAGTIGFSWIVLLAFLRLSTKVGLFPSPLPVDAACRRVQAWLAQPNAVVLEPTLRHPQVLTDLLVGAGTGGNLTSDAHLAALAVEHQATIVTYDRDFGRFPGVSWCTPTAETGAE